MALPSQPDVRDELRRRTAEAPLIRNIVHKQNSHGAPVVRRRNGPEALLARGIPYLQLHALAVELNGADLEVDTDSGNKRGRERVFAEAQ
jgi:hypothetical protein